MLTAIEGEIVSIRVPWPNPLSVIEANASKLVEHVRNELSDGLTLANDYTAAYFDRRDSSIVRTYRVIRTPEQETMG